MKNPIFVIQKHDATKLHYDLRLEKNGVLLSFALPKKPPQRKGIKRLAIPTEDHPLEYANFSGRIPEGFYGAGRVEIYDKGYYVPIEFGDDKIVLKLYGEKLKGKYCLIKLKDQKNYLFFKI